MSDEINISIEDEIFNISIDGKTASGGSSDWADITNKPTSPVADIDDAVVKKHTQNTDTKLDEGGVNEKSADELVISSLDGDWKKVTEIQYNVVTQKLKFKYEE